MSQTFPEPILVQCRRDEYGAAANFDVLNKGFGERRLVQCQVVGPDPKHQDGPADIPVIRLLLNNGYSCCTQLRFRVPSLFVVPLVLQRLEILRVLMPNVGI